MLLSPTVLRFATAALVAGVIVFTIVGLAGGGDVSTADTVLAAVVWGGPISAVIGVAAGLIWEKLLRPMRARRNGADTGGEGAPAARRGASRTRRGGRRGRR